MNIATRHFTIFLSAFLLSFIVGIIGVAKNDWFGRGDLFPYAFYCIPFAAFLSGAASLYFRIARRWFSWLAVPVAFVLGTIGGFVGTYAVAIFLGPWFGAMSVPMLKSWCVAGAIFIPSVYLTKKGGTTKSSIVGASACAGFGVVLFVGMSPLWSLATGDQHLMTAFFRHVPGEQELRIIREPDWLTAEDRDLILASGLTGTLRCFRSGGSNSTDWPRAKAFVIFTSDLSHPVRLPQPKRSTILYIQHEGDFIPIPRNAPTLERAIKFYEGKRGWAFWIEQASGSRSGGDLSLPTE